ncbi:MAG: response regulator [Candidatus Aenigmarchaeota archaeon]|nr:response regulator [Candidatus Aenigmarchaeota archaeon]
MPSILIVEDEKIVAQDLELTLKGLGYSIAGTADTGEEAVEKAGESKPDIVLMDIKLKGKMDGLEAAKKISDKYEIPVVFLTAYLDSKKLQKAAHAKAFGYIVKPFEEKNLRTTIQMALNKKEEMKKLASDASEVKLDLYNRKILWEMDNNCRISASEIGRRVRLPKGTVNYRITKLIEEGYIKRAYAVVNVGALGYNHYRLFMKFHKTTPEIEKEITDFVFAEQGCLAFSVTEGAFNIILDVAYKDIGGLKKFLENFSHKFGDFLLGKNISYVTRVHQFCKRFMLSEKAVNPCKFLADYELLKSCSADIVDRKVLQALLKDARVNLMDIGKEARVDWKVVKYRIKKMEKNGIILGYTTDFDMPKLKQEVVQVNVNLKDFSSIPGAIEFFRSRNVCMAAYELLGKYSLCLKISVKNHRMLKEILEGFQAKFAGSCISLDVSHISSEYPSRFSVL